MSTVRSCPHLLPSRSFSDIGGFAPPPVDLMTTVIEAQAEFTRQKRDPVRAPESEVGAEG